MLGVDKRPDDRVQVRQQAGGLYLTGECINSCQEMFPAGISAIGQVCFKR